MGFEPTTPALRKQCSTVELRWHANTVRLILSPLRQIVNYCRSLLNHTAAGSNTRSRTWNQEFLPTLWTPNPLPAVPLAVNVKFRGAVRTKQDRFFHLVDLGSIRLVGRVRRLRRSYPGCFHEHGIPCRGRRQLQDLQLPSTLWAKNACLARQICFENMFAPQTANFAHRLAPTGGSGSASPARHSLTLSIRSPRCKQRMLAAPV